jgi:hypothetical protein
MTAPTALPYGMRDVKLTRYTDASGTTLDTTSVDLPNMQTFSFSEAEEYQELRGDDRVIAIRGKGAVVDWEIDAGGINLAAWEILTGGRVILSGITPNRKWTLRKLATDARPYFRAEGQAISDSGGDTHIIVYRCKANDTVSGDLADGEFFITNASGQGLPMLQDNFDLLYDIVQNETATLIPSTPTANPAAPPVGLTAGAPTGSSPTAQTILNWTAPSGPAPTTYNIYRRLGAAAFAAGTPATVAHPTVTSTQTALASGTWQFYVTATTGGLESQPSNTVTVVVP